MIKVEAVYQRLSKDVEKFLGFKATIGDHEVPLPFGFLRISELSALETLLKEAYDLGVAEGQGLSA